MTRNAGLRIIALLLAIGLWFFVNAGQREAETVMQVPVEYRGLASGLMIVNPHPDFIDLQISGPRTLLSLLDPGRLTLRLELRGVGPGRADFKIAPELFRVPRQTSIDRISPADIALDIDQIITRNIPVHLNLSGQPDDGYRVGALELKPATVTVTGPAHKLDRYERVESEPFDIKGATADVSRRVRLLDPGALLRLVTDEVLATARIQEVLSSREFRGIEVNVRDAGHRFKVAPHQIDITLRGPLRKLAGTTLDGAVYVDAHGIEPGLHDLPVQVDLPGGLELVRQTPEKVRLRVYKDKRGSSS